MIESKERITSSRTESLIDKKIYSIDEALDQIGGFGLFQLFTTFACTLARNSGDFLFIGFGFLTLAQRYVCLSEDDGSYKQCSIESVCQGRDHGLRYRVDTSYEDYVENWQ